MKIQLLSDLHLEQNPGFQPQPAPDADLLVLAGDIGSYQRGSQLPARGDGDFGLARFSPLPRGAGWPVPVLYVPGNHEYDGLDVDATHARLRSSDARYGLTPGTAGFCNALDALLEQADLWLHGHLHCAVDYRVGRCRVWANPLGYAAKGEQGAFDPAAVATLAPAAD